MDSHRNNYINWMRAFPRNCKVMLQANCLTNDKLPKLVSQILENTFKDPFAVRCSRNQQLMGQQTQYGH